MMIFHRHKWQEDGTKYTPAKVRSDPMIAFWETPDYFLDSWSIKAKLLGFTTIRQKCTECGYVETRNVIGDASK